MAKVELTFKQYGIWILSSGKRSKRVTGCSDEHDYLDGLKHKTALTSEQVILKLTRRTVERFRPRLRRANRAFREVPRRSNRWTHNRHAC